MCGGRFRPVSSIADFDQSRDPACRLLAHPDCHQCSDDRADELGEKSIRDYPEFDSEPFTRSNPPPWVDAPKSTVGDGTHGSPRSTRALGPGNPLAATGKGREVMSTDKEPGGIRHRIHVKLRPSGPDPVSLQRLIAPAPDAISILSPNGVVPGMEAPCHPPHHADRDVLRKNSVDSPGDLALTPRRTTVFTPNDLADRVDTAIGAAREHRRWPVETEPAQALFQLTLNGAAARLALRPPKRGSIVGDRQLQGSGCIVLREIDRPPGSRQVRYATNSIRTSGAASPRRTPSFDIRVYPPATSSYLGATTSKSRFTAGA